LSWLAENAGYRYAGKITSGYFLNKQLRMTYNIQQFNKIVEQSDSKNSVTVHQIELGNLPRYVRLELKKL
jgi:hypothetical protein